MWTALFSMGSGDVGRPYGEGGALGTAHPTLFAARLLLVGGLVYLDFYGLKEPPFSITPNPKYLFYSGKHREALNHLLYGIRERKGFVQITGEVGAGKTTLCRALLEQLGNNYSTALILNPALDPDLLVKNIGT